MYLVGDGFLVKLLGYCNSTSMLLEAFISQKRLK